MRRILAQRRKETAHSPSSHTLSRVWYPASRVGGAGWGKGKVGKRQTAERTIEPEPGLAHLWVVTVKSSSYTAAVPFSQPVAQVLFVLFVPLGRASRDMEVILSGFSHAIRQRVSETPIRPQTLHHLDLPTSTERSTESDCNQVF